MIERDGWLPISLEPRQSTASSFIYITLFAPAAPVAAPVVVVVVERFSLLSLLLAQLAAPVVCGVMAALY